jgi:hypothetical protein
MTFKRKVIKLHPDVMAMLEKYKDNIHNHMSKRRVPLTWNEFILAICSDWENGRSKCGCGMFYDCPHCHHTRRYFQAKQREEYD